MLFREAHLYNFLATGQGLSCPAGRYTNFPVPCTQRFWLCPVDFRKPAIQSTDIYRPMHLRLLPEKGKYNSEVYFKMEMLVTKFSKGKYRNEGELFAEPISKDNVKLMGEMIALQALRTIKKYDIRVVDKLYIGLIKDLHHMNEVGYIVSDGYDVAQTAICFLYQFVGRKVSEIYGRDRKGKEITIKLACYREVNHFIDLLRNRPDRRGTIVESIDFTDYKALPADPVDCFEHEQTDYTKYDELVGVLHLSALELAVLDCYMNGMVQSEVCAELGIGRGSINFRKASIRKRYQSLYGAY